MKILVRHRSWTSLKRRHERGMAIITAIWLTLIGVMLVTTISTALSSSLVLSSAAGVSAKARLAAESGIMKAIAELIADRPRGSQDTTGMTVTEVGNIGYAGPTVNFSGYYVNGATDRVALYNWGDTAVDLNGWTIDAPSGYTDYTFSTTTMLKPDTYIWVTSNFGGNTVDSLILTLTTAQGVAADSVSLKIENAGEKWLCLPAGANAGGYGNGQRGDTNYNPINPYYGQHYYWVKAPFMWINTGEPSGFEGADSGIWLYGYHLQKCLGGTDTVATYTFTESQCFMRYDTTLILSNDMTTDVKGWTFALNSLSDKGFRCETGLVTTTDSSIVAMNHMATGANATSYTLSDAHFRTVSATQPTNMSSVSSRYERKSVSDPYAAMVLATGTDSPRLKNAAYDIVNNQPFIGEIYDTANSEFTATTIVIGGIFADLNGAAAQDAIMLYNPTASDIDLGAGGWDLQTGPFGLGSWTITAPFSAGEIIKAFGYYLCANTNYSGSPIAADHTDASNEINITANSKTRVRQATVAKDLLGWGTALDFEGAVYNANAIGSNDGLTRWQPGRDNNNNSTDFTWFGDGRPLMRNSASAPDIWPIGGNEFIELCLGRRPQNLNSRKREFIEIQNTDSATVTLNGGYWISVDSGSNTTTANRRYLYPLWDSTATTLEVGEVGVIVGTDADTFYIAALSGLPATSIKWFGLGPVAATATDTLLYRAGRHLLPDTAVAVVIGYSNSGVEPASAPYWYGTTFPGPGGNIIGVRSWRKISLTIRDDTTSPFTYFPGRNWDSVSLSPNPGVPVAAGRSGYDGFGDSWYHFCYDSFVVVDSSPSRPYDIYYTTRIFDEGAKVNLNYLSMRGVNKVESGVLIQLLSLVPNPPFAAVCSYYDAGYTPPEKNARALTDSVISFGATATQTALLTPLSPYLIWGYAATSGGGPPRDKSMDSPYIPFMSVYGYNEANVFPVNVNMAETPALTAFIVMAIKDSPTNLAGTPFGVAAASAVANKIYLYLTGNDFVLSTDTGFDQDSDLFTVPSLTAPEVGALRWADNNGNLATYLAYSSTNYFLIYSTGLVYNKGASTSTDTPLAAIRSVAVVRRSANEDKADIIYWREVFEQADPTARAFTFAVGTKRYPKNSRDLIQ